MNIQKLADLCQARFALNTQVGWAWPDEDGDVEEFFARSAAVFNELAKRAEGLSADLASQLLSSVLSKLTIASNPWFGRMRQAINQMAEAYPEWQVHCLLMAMLLDLAFAEASGYKLA